MSRLLRKLYRSIHDLIFNDPDIDRYDPQRERHLWKHRTKMWEYSEFEKVFTKWHLAGRETIELDESECKKLKEEMEFSRERLRDGDQLWEVDDFGEVGIAAFRKGRLVEIICCWEVYRRFPS